MEYFFFENIQATSISGFPQIPSLYWCIELQWKPYPAPNQKAGRFIFSVFYLLAQFPRDLSTSPFPQRLAYHEVTEVEASGSFAYMALFQAQGF